MVNAENSRPRPGHSAGNPPNLNHTNELLDFKLQCTNSGPFASFAQEELLGSAIPHIPGSNAEFLKRGFFILGHCENQTSVMCSAGCPGVQIPKSSRAKDGIQDLNNEEDANICDLKKYLFQKDLSTNRIVGEESEMHEDTEEINALLYSDDDSHYSSDDETSTGHSPPLIKVLNDNQNQEINEEVASSDGPRKRQRLLDSGYMKLSDTTLSVKVEGFNSGYSMKTSYTRSLSKRDKFNSGLSNLSSKKDKIRDTVRLLESMVPGAEGKDPILIIDAAIDYLKSLKFKAKAFGAAASLPQCDVRRGCQGMRKGDNRRFLCENDC